MWSVKVNIEPLHTIAREWDVSDGFRIPTWNYQNLLELYAYIVLL